MRVLAIESTDGAADDAVQALRDAGHTVMRCHEPGAPAFPCNALRDGGECPLDRDVDVVLDVRGHPDPRPTCLEDGVACALRELVPVVIAGSGSHPYGRYDVVHAGQRDVIEACEQAAGANIEGLARLATAAADDYLRRFGHGPAHVTVHRKGRRLKVRVYLDPDDREMLGERVAVAVNTALRPATRFVDAVDVAIAFHDTVTPAGHPAP